MKRIIITMVLIGVVYVLGTLVFEQINIFAGEAK